MKRPTGCLRHAPSAAPPDEPGSKTHGKYLYGSCQPRPARQPGLNPAEGASFFDLFAGIGSVGIEALSRGTRRVVFVERHPRVAALLRENLVACQLSGEWQILPRDVLEALTALQAQREQFDIIFLDPPYEAGWVERTLPWLARPSLLLEPAGELIVQHSPREVPLPAYGPLQRRALKSYGDTQLSFLRPV